MAGFNEPIVDGLSNNKSNGRQSHSLFLTNKRASLNFRANRTEWPTPVASQGLYQLQLFNFVSIKTAQVLSAKVHYTVPRVR